MAKNLAEMMQRFKEDEVFRNFDGIQDGGSFERILKYIRKDFWKVKAVEKRVGPEFEKLTAKEESVANKYNAKMLLDNDYDGFNLPRIDAIYVMANCRTIDNSNVPYYYFDAIRKEFVSWYAGIRYRQDVRVIFKDNQFKDLAYMPNRDTTVKFDKYAILNIDENLDVEVNKIARGRKIPEKKLIKLGNWHTSSDEQFGDAVNFLNAWMEYMLIDEMYKRYRIDHNPGQHSEVFPDEVELLVMGTTYLMYYGVSEGILRADCDTAFKEAKYLADCEKKIVIYEGGNNSNNFELLAWLYSYFINKAIVTGATPPGFER